MKDVPEIAPEIRGLMEEIVADPRSAIRLAPRRALSTWFDTGETVRASDVSRTKAERHLVEAHREELAALLCEASWISYWKAPVLSYRPVGSDGKLYNPTEREPEWRRRAEPEVGLSHDGSTGIALLRRCLVGIQPRQGLDLAQAALSLVPSDKTRCYVALNSQWSTPGRAIMLFRRIALRAQPADLRPRILDTLGSLTCSLGLLAEARESYRGSSALDPRSPYGWACAFNLSCFLGDATAAREEGAELGKAVGPRDPRVLELRDLLRDWGKARSERELLEARSVIQRITDQIPDAARELCQPFEP